MAACIATNAASVDRFFGRTLTLNQLENDFGADIQSICTWFASIYSTPEVRFDTITVELQGVVDTRTITSLPGVSLLAAYDIGQRVTVERTPPGSGSPSTISIPSVIEGITYALDASSSSYLVTYSLGTDQRSHSFLLDDTDQGVLDSAHLSF